MTNYLSRFTPRLASLSAPLRDLRKKTQNTSGARSIARHSPVLKAKS